MGYDVADKDRLAVGLQNMLNSGNKRSRKKQGRRSHAKTRNDAADEGAENHMNVDEDDYDAEDYMDVSESSDSDHDSDYESDDPDDMTGKAYTEIKVNQDVRLKEYKSPPCYPWHILGYSLTV